MDELYDITIPSQTIQSMNTATIEIDGVLAFLDEELCQSTQSLSKAMVNAYRLEKLVVSKQCLMSATIFLSHQYKEIATTQTVLQDLRKETVTIWIQLVSQWNDDLCCIECIHRLSKLFLSTVSNMMYKRALP